MRRSERGQGTVEYVAVMLLIAGVLAVAVGAAKDGGGPKQLADAITKELNQAIDSVSK